MLVFMLPPSMMLVESDTFNIVPGGGLVAEKALADFGLFHARDPHRDHLKMHHVVARRGLVALDAGL